MESIKELYELYERYIFRYLYGLTLDHYKAEELTQETFFQVIKSLHRFRGDCHVSTWIYRIARNVFGEYCRKNKIITVSIDEGLLDIPDEDDTEKVFDKRENSRLIKTTLLKIPDKQREVLWLRDFQELAYEEIAIITGHSVSWVKVNIHRARLAFKKAYFEGGDLNG